MSLANQLRIVQINAENLFLFMEKYQGQDLRTMTERDWQSLSYASVPNKLLYKCLWLADSLLDINPDIILLNEVGGLESLENFSRHFLKDQYRALLIEGNSERGIDIGYLVKKNLAFRYLLNSHKNRSLNLTYPHERQMTLSPPEADTTQRLHFFSRDVAELRLFKGNEESPSLVLLLIHLKSKWDREGFDPEGRDRRQAEVNKLCEIYQELRLELGPEVPIILAGDFNGRARQKGMEPEFTKIYSSTDLREIFDILNQPLEQTATQVQFRRWNKRTLLQIDHIFISPHLVDRLIPDQCFTYKYRSDLRVTLPYPETLEQRNALPSDHYPVVMTINWPP